MKNKGPVTVPDNRCSRTVPVDQHQPYHNITHSQSVLSGKHPCVFCQITPLYQQGSSHYITTGKVMSPNT